jgi:hypothetical protein
MPVLPLRLILCLPLALIGCQATPASLAKKELAPVPASLADQLPGDTVLYFSLPDVPAMRANMQKSMMLRIYHEPEMQGFLSGGLEMLDEAWGEFRAQAATQGVAPELLQWNALRSFEAGFAVRPAPGHANPFEAVPEIQAMLRIGIEPGLGNTVFDLLVGMVGEHGFQVVQGEGRRTLIIEDSIEEGSPLSVKAHGLDDALLIELQWGAPGAGRLSDAPAYRRAWHRNAVPGSAAFGYFQFHDLASAMFLGLSTEQPAVAEMMGEFFEQVLRPIESVSFASGWNDNGSFTNASLDLSEDAGELWKPATLDRGLAARVPAAATSFSITSSNSGPWMALMMRTIDRVGAFAPEESPMSLGQILAMSVPELHSWIYGEHRSELDRALASFGSAGFSYSVPTSGLSSESFSFVELSDPEGMSAVLEQLMPRLREVLKTSESPVHLEMRRTKRKTTQADGTVVESAGPAYYWLEFDLPPEFAQVAALIGQAFKPSFGVAPEGWLVFSMSKDSVSQMLRDGMVMPEHNILENAEAAKFISAAQESAIAISWSDPRPAATAALGMLSGFIPMLGGMIGDQVQLPVDLTTFPEADVFVRNMRTQESVSYAWLGDYRSSLTGNFGFADLFTSLGAIISIAPPFIGMASSMIEGFAEGVPEPDPGMVEF